MPRTRSGELAHNQMILNKINKLAEAHPVHDYRAMLSACRHAATIATFSLVGMVAPAAVTAQPPNDDGVLVPDAAVPDPVPDPVPEPPAPAPKPPASVAPRERSASDAKGAPLPGAESGRIDNHDDDDSMLRIAVRGLLFLPKIAVQVVFAPFRGGVWAYERFQLGARVHDIFFNDEGTIGLYPTVGIESGFGVTVGASFVDRDLFGDGERLSLKAATGGQFRQIYKARLDSGNRLGHRAKIELAGVYELRPKDAFYGIGNDDPEDMDLDPAIETRFRKTKARGTGVVDINVASDLHVRASEELTDVTFANSAEENEAAIDSVYMPSSLVGFGGYRASYTELELRWDSRRRGSEWDPDAVRGTGWLLATFAGRSVAIGAGSDYWRYGGEIQRFIHLTTGPRVISARLYGEAVSGKLGDVPFDELPRLGGKFLLRGYPLDRFRDRVAALGSVEYSWDLARRISASTFIDVGRVFSTLRDANFEELRIGYGVGLEFHTNRKYVMGLSVASSIDGGIFLNLGFDPAFDTEPRTGRK